VTTTTLEQRPLAEAPEFRSEENGRRIVAEGVAMRYGTRSKPIANPARGVFREEFRSGAFTKSLAEQEVRAHLEHGGPFLARTGSGTLVVLDTPTELRYEIDLPDTTAGRDAANLLGRRDVAGASVGFRSLRAAEKWTRDEDGLALRSVGTAHLGVIDLTTSPAYTTTTAEMALRSLADDLGVELRSLLEATDLAALIDAQEIPPGDEERSGEETGSETRTGFRAPLTALRA
jgi:HK97 family phage prohead protease